MYELDIGKYNALGSSALFLLWLHGQGGIWYGTWFKIILHNASWWVGNILLLMLFDGFLTCKRPLKGSWSDYFYCGVFVIMVALWLWFSTFRRIFVWMMPFFMFIASVCFLSYLSWILTILRLYYLWLRDFSNDLNVFSVDHLASPLFLLEFDVTMISFLSLANLEHSLVAITLFSSH